MDDTKIDSALDHLQRAEDLLRDLATEAGRGDAGRDLSATATQVAGARQRLRGVFIEHDSQGGTTPYTDNDIPL